MFTLTLNEDGYGNVYKDCEIIAIELERTLCNCGDYEYELVVHDSYVNGIKVVKISNTYERKELVTKCTAGFKLKLSELSSSIFFSIYL